jgi:uncharacterized membrane protein YdbT with pleckstrin-like domain
MLTEAEKKRIEEEEAYRAQVRARLATGKTPSHPPADLGPEEVLYQGSPSMRARPLKFWGSLLVSGVAIAAVVLIHHNMDYKYPHVLWAIAVILLILAIHFLIWWFTTRSVTLTITNRKTMMDLGWFSKSRTEVFHDDVRTVEVQQSFINRLTGHGTFQISSAGESDWEIKVADLPNVKTARDLVQQHRKR